MTTFQDPQPQSRRAVRQGERGDTSDQAASFAQQGSGQQPSAPQFYSDPQASRDMWDTTARRAAQLPPAAPRQDGAPAAPGRRAAAASQAASTPSAGEPLGYSTQQKPSVPSYDGPSFRSRAAQVPDVAPQPPTQAAPQAPAQAAPQAPTQAAPQAPTQAGSQAPTPAFPPAEQQPVYRVRDFSPEGRRASSPQVEPSWSVPTSPSDLDYRTELRAGYGAAGQAAPAPVYQVPPALAPQAPAPFAQALQAPALVEQTLSRRELRAIQQAELGQTELGQTELGKADLQYPSAPVVPSPQAPVQAAPAQYSPVTGDPFATGPAYSAPGPALAYPAPAYPAAASSAPGYPAPTSSAPAYPAPAYSAPPEPATNTALTNAISEFDSLAAGHQATGQLAPSQQAQLDPTQQAQAQSARQVRSGRARVGHWSTQAQLEDEVPETTINRRIGSGNTATNALVLPTIPAGADIRGPLTGTGEIMLTGSIDLPRSLSSTGASGRIEHGGIDEFFDLHDAEAVSTDSSPVRAIRAVSTHPSGHGVTHTQKPKGTRALTALLIAASSMAVVVAGLLVAAFAFNVF